LSKKKSVKGGTISISWFHLAYFPDNVPDVLGHHLGVAADVEVRPLLPQQAPQPLTRLTQQVRHIPLLRLQEYCEIRTVLPAAPGWLFRFLIFSIPDLGFQMPDRGFRIPDIGFRISIPDITTRKKDFFCFIFL
jgi:hypothetical protein